MTTYSSSTAGVHGRATARGAGHTRTSAPAYHIIICLINIIYIYMCIYVKINVHAPQRARTALVPPPIRPPPEPCLRRTESESELVCPYTVTRSTVFMWLRKIARATRALRQHSWMRWKAHCIANDENTGMVRLSFRLKGS